MVVGVVGERDFGVADLVVGVLGGGYSCVEGEEVLGGDGYGGA